jgi:hypothetical protein
MQQMKEGGIPTRYKNMGFSKVGAKKESTRPGKKWMVLAKKGSDYKVVHGGYDGMKDFSQHGSEKRKDRFWDRMGGKNSAKAKDPFSPLYWHKRFGTWQDGGEIYEMGGYIPEYGMGGMPCYECGGADMNAWAKQVAAMDKEVAKQNAAQYAGQRTFDYDWMQSPVDKAEKKAAIAQYKQFIQQNPNVFVADDSSGYNPEQKYIIASKLKQKSSTPMGSKAFQQKFNQDARLLDLGRIQSDIVPLMGGWSGIQNWLFGNKKFGGYIGQDGKRHMSKTPTWSGNTGYKQGGPVIGEEMEVTPEQLDLLRAQGYEFEII